MPPLVSINLCCYNGEQYLEETLLSILAQTYKDWELVVINDGSTDATEAILEAHMAEGWPIVYHYQPNAGLGASRNRALAMSSGALIAFIDQDDLWMPDKLAQQVPLFQDPQVGLAYTDVVLFKDSSDMGRSLEGKGRPPQGHAFRELLVEWPIALVSVMVRKEAVDGLEQGFDAAFFLLEEKDLFTRLAYRWKIAYLDAALAKWRVHGGSASHRRFGRFATENEMLLNKLERLIPDFAQTYQREVEAAKEKILYQKAIGSFLEHEAALARQHLAAIKWRRAKYFLAYLMSYFPSSWSPFFEEVYWRFLAGRV